MRPGTGEVRKMVENEDLSSDLERILADRAKLEDKLQRIEGELSEQQFADYDRSYSQLQRTLAHLFVRSREDEPLRIRVMLEITRIMENKLVYLQNFVMEPTADNKSLAALVGSFISDLAASRNPVLTNLEYTYYTGVAALYAGNHGEAAKSFRSVCESEESDETNDVKYKSYVILGNLSHADQDYEQARDLHDRSMKYSHHNNVTAQALAFKALNSYALREFDEALSLFQEALKLFDRNGAFFNSYFHRNALLFCGSIHLQKKQYSEAESFYGQVLEQVQQSSYDHFDALCQLGKIRYNTGRFDEALNDFDRAVQMHQASENEYLVDTWFWLARTHLKKNEPVEARKLLEKIAASEVAYQRKPQAAELLQRVS